MSYAAAMSIDELEPAWQALQDRAPAKLRTIDGERHYRSIIGLMNELIDEIGDRQAHPLQGLLDIVTLLVTDYEARQVKLPDAAPAEVLRFLMQQHGLRQADLAELFGSQSNVSEILAGKRAINLRQAKALGKRFGTSPSAFI